MTVMTTPSSRTPPVQIHGQPESDCELQASLAQIPIREVLDLLDPVKDDVARNVKLLRGDWISPIRGGAFPVERRAIAATLTAVISVEKHETLSNSAFSTRERSHRVQWWAAGFGAAAGALVMVLAHRALADDAWITLGYARNLAEHGHWGLLPDRTSNTQTSPLNAWVLGALLWAVGQPVVAVGMALMGAFALVGWWSTQLGRILMISPAFPFVLIALLASSPLVVSSIGLETYLGITVLIGIARYASDGHRSVAAVLWGLAVLCRPDFVVPAGAIVVILLWPKLSQRWLHLTQAALLGALVALPWHLWSWYRLGGFVPDTTFIKVIFPGSPTMVSAAYDTFYPYYPVATLLTAIPVAAALVCVLSTWHHRRQPWARLMVASVIAGWTHWGALVAIDAFPQAWYFAPLVSCSILALSIGIARTAHMSAFGGAGILAIGCLVAAGPAPWPAMPLVYNLARSTQYLDIGSQLPRLTNGEPVAGPGEIGALAFGSRGLVVDHFGDPWLTKTLLDQRYRNSGSLERAVLRLNWTHYPEAAQPVLPYKLTFRSVTPDPTGKIIRTWQIDLPARGTDQLVLSRN